MAKIFVLIFNCFVIFFSYRQETSLLRVISTMISTPPVVNELTLYFVQITEKSKQLLQVRHDQLRNKFFGDFKFSNPEIFIAFLFSK